jgi:hypothetical protein
MRTLIASIFVMLLVVSPTVLAQGTTMMSLRQNDCPLMFLETKHGVQDFLLSAKLRNQSDQLVTGYRIGWVAVYPTGKERVGLGLSVDLPLGIEPGATIGVPAQGVSPDFVTPAAMSVVFFVTDVRTASVNGDAASNVWSPSLDKFEEQALTMTKEQQAFVLRQSEKHSEPSHR